MSGIILVLLFQSMSIKTKVHALILLRLYFHPKVIKINKTVGLGILCDKNFKNTFSSNILLQSSKLLWLEIFQHFSADMWRLKAWNLYLNKCTHNFSQRKVSCITDNVVSIPSYEVSVIQSVCDCLLSLLRNLQSWCRIWQFANCIVQVSGNVWHFSLQPKLI